MWWMCFCRYTTNAPTHRETGQPRCGGSLPCRPCFAPSDVSQSICPVPGLSRVLLGEATNAGKHQVNGQLRCGGPALVGPALLRSTCHNGFVQFPVCGSTHTETPRDMPRSCRRFCTSRGICCRTRCRWPLTPKAFWGCPWVGRLCTAARCKRSFTRRPHRCSSSTFAWLQRN